MDNELISNDILILLHPIDSGLVDIEAGRISRNSIDIINKMNVLCENISDDDKK